MRVWSIVPQSGFTDLFLRPPKTPSDEMNNDICHVFGLDPSELPKPPTYQPSHGQCESSTSNMFGTPAAEPAVYLEWEQDALEQ